METNSFQRKTTAVFAQKTHNDLFPKEDREHRYTKRHLLPVHLHLETTILWQTLLVELKVRQHLDSCHHTTGGNLRQLHCITQNTVDAITHHHFFFERFNMNIRRSLDDGVPKQGVNDTNHWQILSGFFKIALTQLLSIFIRQDLKVGGVLHDDVAKLIFEILLILPQRVAHRLGIR